MERAIIRAKSRHSPESVVIPEIVHYRIFVIADRAKKKLQSGQFREGRSGFRKQELFFFGLNTLVPPSFSCFR